MVMVALSGSGGVPTGLGTYSVGVILMAAVEVTPSVGVTVPVAATVPAVTVPVAATVPVEATADGWGVAGVPEGVAAVLVGVGVRLAVAAGG